MPLPGAESHGRAYHTASSRKTCRAHGAGMPLASGLASSAARKVRDILLPFVQLHNQDRTGSFRGDSIRDTT